MITVPRLAPHLTFAFHKVTEVFSYAFNIIVIGKFKEDEIMMAPVMPRLAIRCKLLVFRFDLGK